MGLRFKDVSSLLCGQSYSNEYFEEYLDTSDQWIVERTGISSRYFYDGTIEDMVKEFCKKLDIKDSSNIKTVLVASCTTRYQIPSLSSIVVGELGLDIDTLSLDINQACSSFVVGLDLLHKYLDIGEEALIIGVEKFSDLLNFDDRSTAILFGDGIGGALVEKTEEMGVFKSFTNYNSQALNYSVDTGLEMEGREVYRFVTRDVLGHLEIFLEENNIDKDKAIFISHQANYRILEALAKKLDISMDQVPTNISYVGNISSGSIPVLLSDLVRENKIKRGDQVVMLAFGAGLSWSFGYFTW